jgi:transcriptional repressor NrdR
MLCIYCSSDTKVTNSRVQKRVNKVWRRRTCLSCKAVFTSIEQADLEKSMTFKQSSSHLEPFLRDKLLLSLYDSLKHRKTATADASALTTTVISQVCSSSTPGLIPRSKLISTALSILEHFDKVAAVHYSAFHSID